MKGVFDNVWRWAAGNMAQFLPSYNLKNSTGAFDNLAVRYAYYKAQNLYPMLAPLLGNDAKKWRVFVNPVPSVAELYASTLLVGKIELETESEAQKQAFDNILRWSNANTLFRRTSISAVVLGSVFLQVCGGKQDANGKYNSVYIKIIDPRNVTDFKTDERGFLTFIRIDVPQDGGNSYYTETWNKQTQERKWYNSNAPLEILPENADGVQTFAEYGCDNFIPIVYAPALIDADGNATTPFASVYDKINIINELQSRLADIGFAPNRPLGVVTANQVDATGAPMPPPSADFGATGDWQNLLDARGIDAVFLPGLADFKFAVPQGNSFDGQHKIIQSILDEIERDLPEWGVVKYAEKSNISTDTLEMLLDTVTAKILSIRQNLENGLAQAVGMAFTIGKKLALDGFDTIGDFSQGDYPTAFSSRPVFGIGKSRIAKLASDLPLDSPVRWRLEYAGVSETDLSDYDEAVQNDAVQKNLTMAAAMAQAQARFDTGAGAG